MLPIAIKHGFHGTAEQIHVSTDDDIRPYRHRNRAFRSVAKGQAGHTQEGSFLLDSTGVCDDYGCFLLQGQKLEVRLRFPELQVSGMTKA
jgi:hypothetical protein